MSRVDKPAIVRCTIYCKGFFYGTFTARPDPGALRTDIVWASLFADIMKFTVPSPHDRIKAKRRSVDPLQDKDRARETTDTALENIDGSLEDLDLDDFARDL